MNYVTYTFAKSAFPVTEKLMNGALILCPPSKATCQCRPSDALQHIPMNVVPVKRYKTQINQNSTSTPALDFISLMARPSSRRFYFAETRFSHLEYRFYVTWRDSLPIAFKWSRRHEAIPISAIHIEIGYHEMFSMSPWVSPHNELNESKRRKY